MTRNLVTLLVATLLASEARGVTFKPVADDQVLEILPRSVLALGGADVLALKRESQAKPADLDAAVALAARLIDVGRATGDPRLYGQAQAALERWWAEPTPPPRVLALRAAIRQFNHEFAPALADLEVYLKSDPGDAQVRLMQATVLIVTGNYQAARAACQALPPRTPPLVPITCNAAVDSLTGQAASALARLVAVAPFLGARDPSVHGWALSTAGEIATRLGRLEQAEALLHDSLIFSPGDAYTTVLLADLLFDLGRPAEALPLVKDRQDQDALLLRLARAEQLLSMPEAKAHADVLAARFAAERARGTMPHLREEAYFELRLRDDPKAALALARTNFQSQREPLDARLLLEAAAAAGDADSAKPALDWLAATATAEPHMEAARLRLAHR